MALYHFRFRISYTGANASVRQLLGLIDQQLGFIEADIDDSQFPALRTNLTNANLVPINITRTLVVTPEIVAGPQQ